VNDAQPSILPEGLIRPSATTARLAEFRRSWTIVTAAALGSGLGISGLLTYNSGLFVKDLEGAIGLSRTQFGFAFFLATLALACAMPVVGRVIDEKGVRLPTIAGSIALAIGFVALGTLTVSVSIYVAIMAAIGLFASASSPVGYTRAVNGVFDKARGLALGLTQLGVGLAGAIIPPILGGVIQTHGWRVGFFFLAGLALLGTLPSLIGLRRKGVSGSEAPSKGPAFAEVRKSRLFWLQMAAFVVMALGFAGMLPHFVPMLRDAGVSPQAAAEQAGLIGLAVIVSRVVVGWLADITEAPWIAATVCAICGFACITLALGGPQYVTVAALALGCAMGCEADLIGYMTVKYFGLASYGRAYARQYAAFILATGIGPFWIGLLVDRTGGYKAPLIVCAALLMVALIIFSFLPRTTTRGDQAKGRS
jgi:MFS family permease